VRAHDGRRSAAGFTRAQALDAHPAASLEVRERGVEALAVETLPALPLQVADRDAVLRMAGGEGVEEGSCGVPLAADLDVVDLAGVLVEEVDEGAGADGRVEADAGGGGGCVGFVGGCAGLRFGWVGVTSVLAVGFVRGNVDEMEQCGQGGKKGPILT